MISNTNINLRMEVIDFIARNGPFAYFVSLTFPRLQTIESCTQQINHLIYLLNRKIFRINTSQYLQGYCVFEKHKVSSNNPLHSHILIKHDDKLDEENKKSFIEHFYTLLGKVKVVKSNVVTDIKAFNSNCCKIVPVTYEHGAIKYITKLFEVPFDIDHFRPLTKYGI